MNAGSSHCCTLLAVSSGLPPHEGPKLWADCVYYFQASDVFRSSRAGLTSYALGKIAQLGLMNALAAEAAPFAIKVNAISPVATTRMLQTTVGPNEHRPEQVAPGVAFLASSQCDFSGVVLRAGNGHYSTARWSFSESITLGNDDLTPEAIARYWNEIKI